ncbi:MAG: TMEM43 family protein [Planctomycetaceae bacterium]|nr:TMEM43 family protein [Planctomycetaceae bacterium]
MAAYTVTKTTGWFERLGNSFGGILFGIVLFLIGTGLLWWNEGRFVKTQTALNEAQGVVQELDDISKADSANNGKLVHATGDAVTADILEDSAFGISVNAIRLDRAVEYYQWTEDSKTETTQKLGGGEEKVTTYTYRKDWVASPVNSSRFNDPQAREKNQNTVLVAGLENFKAQAENVTFGAYRLPKFFIDSISASEPYTVVLSDEAIEKLSQQIAPSASSPTQLPTPDTPVQPAIIDSTSLDTLSFDTFSTDVAGSRATEIVTSSGGPILTVFAVDSTQMVHVSGSTVYLGLSPAQPAIGDVRATFKWTKPENTVSLIAKLNNDTFESYVAKNGKTVSMLSVGTHSAENMFQSAHTSNSNLTWFLRFLGVFLVCMSLRMMVAPLEVLASVIPFLGKLVGVGTGLFSMLFGTAWSLAVIAMAWLFYRPLIGILLLAAAVGLIVLLMSKRGAGKAGGKVYDGVHRSEKE